MNENIRELFKNDRGPEIREEINAMLDQPAITPMPEPVANRVLAIIFKAENAAQLRTQPRIVQLVSSRWLRYAAVLLLIAGSAIYIYFQLTSTHGIRSKSNALAEPILRSSNRATLTLADGRTIVLDSVENGALAMQGNTHIVKVDAGSLSYHGDTDPGPSRINILRTPNGGQYQVTLPDGTVVWLNAASSITFPTAFGKERTVTITGEAYLNVAARPGIPFYVILPRQTRIEVLGTGFNVNAYPNESGISTTLINGSVKVVRQNNTGIESIVLRPGQQAQVKQEVPIILADNVDLDKITAWRKGYFNFEGASLPELTRQLERWYGIEVVFESGIPDTEFFGEMRRDAQLSVVLQALQKAGVHFRMEDGRRLVILP